MAMSNEGSRLWVEYVEDVRINDLSSDGVIINGRAAILILRI